MITNKMTVNLYSNDILDCDDDFYEDTHDDYYVTNHRKTRQKFETICEDYNKFMRDNKRTPKCSSPNKFEKSLANWFSYAKSKYNSGKLSIDKVDKLEPLINLNCGKILSNTLQIHKQPIHTVHNGGCGLIDHPGFLRNVEELRKWINDHNCNYPTITENSRLYGFISNTRRSYQKYKKNINEYGIRINAIEQLPNWTWTTKKVKKMKHKPIQHMDKHCCNKFKKPCSKIGKHSQDKQLIRKIATYLNVMSSRLSKISKITNKCFKSIDDYLQ